MAATVTGVTVTVDQAGVRRLMTSHGNAMMQTLVTLGNRVLNNSRARVNVDTGYLRSTGTLEEDNVKGMVRVAYRAHYARWVHEPSESTTWAGNPYLTDALKEEMSRL